MKPYGEVLKNVDREEIANLTLDLVEIPSPTGRELEAAKFYAKFLEESGLEVQLDYIEEDRPNVIARIPGKGEGPNLMLGGHIDTIPIEKCVSPKIEGGRVYGRGACDMKGSLAAMAEAAKAIVKSGIKLKGDLFIVGWVDHEAPIGRGAGPKAIARKISQGELKVDAAVITEGPMDSVQVAQGGMAVFTVSVAGPPQSIHTTLVPLRSNPILWTAELIKEIQEMDEELNRREWHPLIPQRPSLQLGIVRGGDFFNRLPTAVEVVGTVRWDPDEDFQSVKRRFEERVKRLEHRIWHEYDRTVNISVDMVLVRDSCEVPRNEEVVKALLKAVETITGKKLDVSGSRAVGDLSIIYKEGGIPAVCYGPTTRTDKTAHSDMESVSIENLETISKIYSTLALSFCGVKG